MSRSSRSARRPVAVVAANREALDARVLEILSFVSAMRASVVADRVGVSTSAATGSLERLIAAGKAEKVGLSIEVRRNAAGPVYRDAAGFRALETPVATLADAVRISKEEAAGDAIDAATTDARLDARRLALLEVRERQAGRYATPTARATFLALSADPARYEALEAARAATAALEAATDLAPRERTEAERLVLAGTDVAVAIETARERFAYLEDTDREEIRRYVTREIAEPVTREKHYEAMLDTFSSASRDERRAFLRAPWHVLYAASPLERKLAEGTRVVLVGDGCLPGFGFAIAGRRGTIEVVYGFGEAAYQVNVDGHGSISGFREEQVEAAPNVLDVAGRLEDAILALRAVRKEVEAIKAEAALECLPAMQGDNPLAPAWAKTRDVAGVTAGAIADVERAIAKATGPLFDEILATPEPETFGIVAAAALEAGR